MLTFRPRKWKTADGRKIKIRDMSDSHIANAIKMMTETISLPMIFGWGEDGPEVDEWDVCTLAEAFGLEASVEALEHEQKRRKKKGITVSRADAFWRTLS